jgi:GINS complex subunit 2
MALPPGLQHGMSPAELELVASEQLVDIVPLVSMDRTAFISVSPSLCLPDDVIFPRQTLTSPPSTQGAHGPLRPPAKSRVPIWMASNLKLKKKCHIVPPPWLSVGTCTTTPRPPPRP